MSADRLITEMGKKIREGAVGRISTLQILISAPGRDVRDVLADALEILFRLTDKKIRRVRFQGDDTFFQGTIRLEDGSTVLLDVDAFGKPRIFVAAQGSEGLVVLPGAPSFFSKIKAGNRNFAPEISRVSALIQKSVSFLSVIDLGA